MNNESFKGFEAVVTSEENGWKPDFSFDPEDERDDCVAYGRLNGHQWVLCQDPYDGKIVTYVDGVRREFGWAQILTEVVVEGHSDEESITVKSELNSDFTLKLL